MTPRRSSRGCTWLCALPLVAASPAAALVHLWDIAEVYSNEDGSVQFVELFTKSFGEVATQLTKLDSTDHSVPLVGPLEGPTSFRSYLIATPGFAGLPGAVVPDVEMPVAPFFRVDGDTLRFRTLTNVLYDSVSFGAGELPLDGLLSLHRMNPGGSGSYDRPGGLFVAENSPTNYAGEVGFLPEPGAAVLGAVALGSVVLVVRRRRLR
jgi:hypothetical protein